MTTTVAVLGLPGAGKGTQAEKLSEELGFKKLDMGDILRANKSYVTEDGKQVGEIIDHGGAVSAKTAADLLSRYLAQINFQEQDGLVLDGYPRTKQQAQEADKVVSIDVILIIDVSKETIFERLTNRRVCPECGEQYHLISDPPEQQGQCDRCSTELIQRADDTREAINERISWQREGLENIVSQYEGKSKIIRVNGDTSISKVWESIKSSLLTSI